jgi:hypothetical protein
MTKQFDGKVEIWQGGSLGVGASKIILDAGKPADNHSSVYVKDNLYNPSIFLGGAGHTIVLAEPVATGG